MGNDKLTTRALALAAVMHGGQVDKVGEPYILHPLRVMLALGLRATDEERAVALLHDVVEDTATTVEGLRATGYPPQVVDAVDALSRREGETYHDYVERCVTNPLARYIKRLDIQDNMLPERMNGLPEHERVGLHKRYRKTLGRIIDADWADAQRRVLGLTEGRNVH